MVPAGDDFAFVEAKKVFDKLDDLVNEVSKYGGKQGYDTTVKYSSLYEYFDEFRSMNLTLGLYEGDFLPYQEPLSSWEDFWTGYYSSRLHMKHYIRDIFHKLQSTKSLLTIKAVQANDGSIEFSQEMEENIDKVNNYILKAEQNWAILMHHDGITGTHTSVTERNYYVMLNQAEEYLEKAYQLIKDLFYNHLSSEDTQELQDILSKLDNAEVLTYTIVNPSLYSRNELMNITLPTAGDDEGYMMFMHMPNQKLRSNVTSNVIDLQELNTLKHTLETTRKIFFDLTTPALSNAFVYVVKFKNGKVQCKKPGITCTRINVAVEMSISRKQSFFYVRRRFFNS